MTYAEEKISQLVSRQGWNYETEVRLYRQFCFEHRHSFDLLTFLEGVAVEENDRAVTQRERSVAPARHGASGEPSNPAELKRKLADVERQLKELESQCASVLRQCGAAIGVEPGAAMRHVLADREEVAKERDEALARATAAETKIETLVREGAPGILRLLADRFERGEM